MRYGQRLFRATFGYGGEALAAAGRAIRRAAGRRRVWLAAFLCFLAGLAAGLRWPWRAPGSPVAPPPSRPSALVPSRPSVPVAPPPAPATAVEKLEAALDFGRPLAGRVTAGFGWRRDPVFQDFRFHPGIDLAGRAGQAVAAAAGGRVASVQAVGSDYGREPSGWEVAVDHPGGWVTRYRFSGTVRVRRAETVVRGQPLGTLTAPAALHFALYRDGQACRPPVVALPEG